MTASEPTGAAPTGASSSESTRGDEVHVDDPTDAANEATGESHDVPADVAPSESRVAPSEASPSLVEMALFAPIDAVFWLLRDPGAAATRGRARVDEALRQARAIGELSIKFGARELRRRTGAQGTDNDPATTASTSRPVPNPDAGPAPDDVITDYDALSASQIVPMLSSLDPAERARVARYEAKSRGRQTILRKIEQLDGPSD